MKDAFYLLSGLDILATAACVMVAWKGRRVMVARAVFLLAGLVMLISVALLWDTGWIPRLSVTPAHHNGILLIRLSAPARQPSQ